MSGKLEPEDIYASIPDVRAPNDASTSVNVLIHKASQVSTQSDGSFISKTEQIIDESGYLQPKQDNDPDFSILAMAFPPENESSTKRQPNPDQSGSSDELTNPNQTEPRASINSSVDESGYLVPRDELGNDGETPYAISENTSIIACNTLQNDPVTSAVDSCAKERVYYSLDDKSSAGRKYYDNRPARASQCPRVKDNKIRPSTSKQKSTDDGGYLVPSVEELPRPISFVEPFPPFEETLVPNIPDTYDKATAKTTSPTVNIDKDDDSVRHTHFGSDDFSEEGDNLCSGATDINERTYFEIGHADDDDDDNVSGSKLPSNKQHGTGDTINSIQHLIDELGYLILNDEKSRN